MSRTPGPWAVHSRFPTAVVPLADRDKHIGGSIDPDVEANEYAKQIANESGSEYPEFARSRVQRGDEAKANARLIAAAPELYDACKLFLACYPAAIAAMSDEQRALIENAVLKAQGDL